MKVLPWIAVLALATAGLLYWLNTNTGAEPGLDLAEREKLNMTVGGLAVGLGLVLWLRAALKS